MAGRIDFKHDKIHDIIVATPHWNLESEADLDTWYGQYVAYMKQFNRKMDFVVVLDNFNVGPSVGPRWGEYRAKIHKEFIRYNYRVHPNSRVKLFTNTSGVRYDVSREEAASVADAVEGILAARKRDGL